MVVEPAQSSITSCLVHLLDDAILDVDVGMEGLVVVHNQAILDEDAGLGALDGRQRGNSKRLLLIAWGYLID